MRPHRTPSVANRARRGSALLMAFLMIILLFGIVFQLWLSTNTDLRVADNEVTNTQMDLAIESAMQEVFDRLKTDGEAAAASQAGAGGGDPLAGGDAPGGEGGAGGEGGEQASDSREDTWGKPQRTSINDIDLRIIVQDEDSKLNVLGILTEDEDMAREALDRLVRVLDTFREDTTLDIDRTQASRIADEIRRHLRERMQSVLPRPALLSDDEDNADVGLPLSLREFVVLEGLDESMFRDGRDERGVVVHSLGSFLTVWTSLTTESTNSGDSGGGNSGGGNSGNGNSNNSNNNNQDGKNGTSNQTNSGNQTGGGGGESGGGGGGGGDSTTANFGVAININTAPGTVLKAMFDDRDISPRFWDSVIEYRNLEDEEKSKDQEGEDTSEPVLDEYGNEIVPRQVFDTVEELSEVDGYDALDAEARNRLPQFVATQSQVFSIYVTAYIRPKNQIDFSEQLPPGAAADKEIGGTRWKTVRAVVWRYQEGEEVKIVPLVRWEALDYIPIEVVDYPDEDR